MTVLSIYCIIEDENKILLTEDVDKPGWKLPGGKVEQNETLFQAAHREVKEETGYDVELTGFVTIHEYFNPKGDHRFRFTLTASRVGGQEDIMTGEVKRVEWVEKNVVESLTEDDFYLEPYYLAVKSYSNNKTYPLSLIQSLVE